MSTSPSDEPIRASERTDVTVPAQAEYVVVARLVTGGVAARAGASFDETEDLKLSVGEACNLAILGNATRISFRFTVRTDEIEIRVTHDGGRRAPGSEAEMSIYLMRCLMDEVRSRRAAGRQVVDLVKRLQR